MPETANNATVPELLPPARSGGSLATQGGNVPAAGGVLTLQALEDLSKAIDYRVSLVDRIKQVIDARVGADCFDRFEDSKPGGEKKITVRRNKNYADVMAAIMGISFTYLKDPAGRPLFQRINYQDDKGPYYIYEVFGLASVAGFSTECSGSAGSRDPLLSHGGKLELDEVIEPFVRQKALTECRKKGILSVLGLDANATEADMKRVGKDAGGFNGHGFQKGSKGGSTDDQGQADRRGEIEKMCRSLLEAGYTKQGQPTPATADAVLLVITMNPPNFGGWRSVKGVSEKALDRTYGDVKRTWEEFTGLKWDKAEGEQGEAKADGEAGQA